MSKNKKMKYTIFIITLLFFSNLLFADNPVDTAKTDAYIIGHVISEGEHIPNVAIQIKGTNIATLTDASGHYRISNAPTGQLTLEVKSIGYISDEVTFTIQNSQTHEINFELKPDNINIDQIVVSSDKTATNRANAPMLVNVISPKLISNSGAVCGADVLNFQPGLRIETNCQNCGVSQLRMNGMEGAYSQILINSRPIFSALNGVYGLEQIPAQMIDRIEIVRGGGSALFGGNAIAGTVNIITKDPVSSSFQINSNLAMINAKTPDFNIGFNTSVISSDLKTGLFIFGLKRNRQPYYANDDDFSEIPLINSNAFGFSAFHKITTQSKISIDFHNINEFRRGGNDFDKQPHLTDITEQTDHNIIGGGINYDYLSKDYKTKFSVFATGQYTTRNSYYGAEQDASAYGFTEDLSFVSGMQFSYNFDRIFISPMKFIFGAENSYTSLTDKKLGYFNFEENTDIDDRIIVNQQLVTPGVYSQTEWDMNKLKLLFGARYDIPDKRLNIDPVFMPRANLLFKVNKISKIRLSYAKGYRAPQVFNEDLHIETSASRQIIHTTSDDLKAEYSNSYSASVDFTKIFDFVQTYVLIEGFHTILKNPFSSEFDFDENTKILTMSKTNSTSGAFVQGINFESKFAFSRKIELQIGGTLQKSEFEEAQPWGDDETLVTKQFTRTPNSYGYAVFYFDPFKTTNISLTGNYTGSMLVPHFAGGLNPQGILITDDQLVETQLFFDAGINVSQTIKITDELKIQISAGIKNIFDNYQNDFDMGINRDAGYIYGPLLPRTFTFGLKLGSL